MSAILHYEAKMQEINLQVNKVKVGSNKISIRNDLAKDGMIFSEESSRAIFDMGNVELILETTQCSSCLKHVFGGMTTRLCVKLPRPYKSSLGRIRAAPEAFQEDRNVVKILATRPS